MPKRLLSALSFAALCLWSSASYALTSPDAFLGFHVVNTRHLESPDLFGTHGQQLRECALDARKLLPLLRLILDSP